MKNGLKLLKLLLKCDNQHMIQNVLHIIQKEPKSSGKKFSNLMMKKKMSLQIRKSLLPKKKLRL